MRKVGDEESQPTHSEDVKHGADNHHPDIALWPQAVQQSDDWVRQEDHKYRYDDIGERLGEHEDERVDRRDVHLFDGADLLLLHHVERWEDECGHRNEHGDEPWDDIVLVVYLRIVAIDLDDADRYGG